MVTQFGEPANKLQSLCQHMHCQIAHSVASTVDHRQTIVNRQLHLNFRSLLTP